MPSSSSDRFSHPSLGSRRSAADRHQPKQQQQQQSESEQPASTARGGAASKKASTSSSAGTGIAEGGRGGSSSGGGGGVGGGGNRNSARPSRSSEETTTGSSSETETDAERYFALPPLLLLSIFFCLKEKKISKHRARPSGPDRFPPQNQSFRLFFFLKCASLRPRPSCITKVTAGLHLEYGFVKRSAASFPRPAIPILIDGNVAGHAVDPWMQ